MKNVKYILFSTIAACALLSCQKHGLSFAPEVAADNMAMFQITYVEPIAVNAANAIDSVFVNNKLVAGSTGVGQLTVNGTYPYGPSTATGKFFATKPGNTNIKFYRKGNLVYDKDVNLIFGAVIDPAMQDQIRITVVATGYPEADSYVGNQPTIAQVTPARPVPARNIYQREPVESIVRPVSETSDSVLPGFLNRQKKEKLDVPPFLKMKSRD